MKIALYLFICIFSEGVWAGEFSAVVKNINVELVVDHYELNADIDYQLSPVAKEALQKGIALTWSVLIKVEQQGRVWNSSVQSLAIEYQIQNHALLNLYSIKRLSTGERSVFSSLAGALNFISKMRRVVIVDKQLIQPDKQYHVAVKVKFKHEALPVPLRPFSYFNSQWALSSYWILWPLQN